MSLQEFAVKYGIEGWSLPMEEFIRRAPEFQGDKEIAKIIGEINADLQSVIEEGVLRL